MFHKKLFRWIEWRSTDPHRNTAIFLCAHLPEVPRFFHFFNLDVVVLDFSVCLFLVIFVWTFPWAGYILLNQPENCLLFLL